jgi:hypothetical protein
MGETLALPTTRSTSANACERTQQNDSSRPDTGWCGRAIDRAVSGHY